MIVSQYASKEGLWHIQMWKLCFTITHFLDITTTVKHRKKTFKIHISQGMENTCFFTGEHIKNINKTTEEFILLQFTELISVTNTLAESHGFLLEILLFSKSLHSALKETGSVFIQSSLKHAFHTHCRSHCKPSLRETDFLDEVTFNLKKNLNQIEMQSAV